MKNNCVNNIFHSLEANEKKVLRQLEEKGFKSPFEEFEDSLVYGNNRRFLEALIEIDYGKIQENQVGKDLIDKDRCRNHLKPWIERTGLQNPSLVERGSVEGSYVQITGHNRAYTEDMIRQKVTVIVVTKNYNLKGDQVPLDIDIINGAHGNKPQKHRTYTIADAAITLGESLKKNPTQDGLNPSGNLPPRKSEDGFDFDTFVDRVYNKAGKAEYPHFPHKATRTKIRNKMIKNLNSSKVIDVKSEEEQTNFLLKLGWDTGLNTKGKRKSVFEHFDVKRSSIVLMADCQGINFERPFYSLIKKWHGCQSAEFRNIIKRNNVRYVDVCARIHGPEINKANLDLQRANYNELITEQGAVLAACTGGRLKIRYIAFPKQLKTSADEGKLYNILLDKEEII